MKQVDVICTSHHLLKKTRITKNTITPSPSPNKQSHLVIHYAQLSPHLPSFTQPPTLHRSPITPSGPRFQLQRKEGIQCNLVNPKEYRFDFGLLNVSLQFIDVLGFAN